MSTIILERFNELRSLHDIATPPPWRVDSSSYAGAGFGVAGSKCTSCGHGEPGTRIASMCDEAKTADLLLIVRARNALPHLLYVADELNKALELLQRITDPKRDQFELLSINDAKAFLRRFG